MEMAPRAKVSAIDPADFHSVTRMASRHPQTLSQAISVLQESLPETSLERIRQHPLEELFDLYLTEGVRIRGILDLWDPNHPLLKDPELRHPDDASLLILEGLWHHLARR